MTKRSALAAVLTVGLTAGAAPLPPVCGDAGVLRQVDEIVRKRGQPLVLEAPVGEVSLAPAAPGIPQAGPPLAHCAVRGHTVGYDTNRYGTPAVYEPFILNYTVELRRNGLFVHVD